MLVVAIKGYVLDTVEVNRQKCLMFADPLLATVDALITFAHSDDSFSGCFFLVFGVFGACQTDQKRQISPSTPLRDDKQPLLLYRRASKNDKRDCRLHYTYPRSRFILYVFSVGVEVCCVVLLRGIVGASHIRCQWCLRPVYLLPPSSPF